MSSRGQILLCIQPSADDVLHVVKWHPRDPDMVAVASENRIYSIDIPSSYSLHRGQPIVASDLPHIAQIYTVSSVSLVTPTTLRFIELYLTACRLV